MNQNKNKYKKLKRNDHVQIYIFLIANANIGEENGNLFHDIRRQQLGVRSQEMEFI